jgi:transcription antitermination factor NusG
MQMRDESQSNWYVVKTLSRAEKIVFKRLSMMGLSVYLPLQTTIKQWSDRKKKIDIPLISGTLFIHGNASTLSLLYHVQGFHSILHFLGKPAIVRDEEINNLKLLLQDNVEIKEEVFEEIKKGESVEVIRGPLQGIIATSVEQQRNYKLIIQIESLGRQFVVHVPRSQVRKVKDKIA